MLSVNVGEGSLADLLLSYGRNISSAFHYTLCVSGSVPVHSRVRRVKTNLMKWTEEEDDELSKALPSGKFLLERPKLVWLAAKTTDILHVILASAS